MSTHFNPLFIGHGSPMNAIESNRYTQFLNRYAQSIRPPETVVVISAHWQTEGPRITGAAHPLQIYDFSGFPPELTSFVYRPKGSPQLAQKIASEIPEIQIDDTRGIDHGAWAVVKSLFPNADIPLIQISLDVHSSARDQFVLRQKLAKFSDENVLFIGSGNVIHNLREITFDPKMPPFSWAI